MRRAWPTPCGDLQAASSLYLGAAYGKVTGHPAHAANLSVCAYCQQAGHGCARWTSWHTGPDRAMCTVWTGAGVAAWRLRRAERRVCATVLPVPDWQCLPRRVPSRRGHGVSHTSATLQHPGIPEGAFTGWLQSCCSGRRADLALARYLSTSKPVTCGHADLS